MAENRKRCNDISRRSNKHGMQSKEREVNEPEVENIIMNQLLDSENYEFIDVDISEYEQPNGYNPSPTHVIEIEDDEDMVTENTDNFINRDPTINNLDLKNNECDNKKVNNRDNINHQTDDAKFYVDFVDCNISSEAVNEVILGNSSLGESEKSSVGSQSDMEESFDNHTTEIKNTVKVKSRPFRNIKTKRLIRRKNVSKPIRKRERQQGFPLEEHFNVNNKLFTHSETRKKLPHSNNIKTVKEACKSQENFVEVSNTIEKPERDESENAVPETSKVIISQNINNAVRNHSRTKINKSVSYKPLSQSNEVEDVKKPEPNENITTNEEARNSISSNSVMSVNGSSETSEYGIHRSEKNMSTTNINQLNNDCTILTNIISDSEEESMERYDYGEKPSLEVESKDTELEAEELSETESLDRKINEIYKVYKSKKQSIPTDIVQPVSIVIDSESDGGSSVGRNKCNETINKCSTSENISLSSYDSTASIDTNIDCSKRRHTLRNVFCKRGGSMSPTTKVMDFWNVDLNNAEVGFEEGTVESQFFGAPWPPTEKLCLDTDGELSGHSDFFRIRAEHPEIDKQHRSTRTLNTVRVFNTNNVVKNNLKVGHRNRNYCVRIGNSHNTVSDIAVKISYNKNNLMNKICNSNNSYFAKHMNMSSYNERSRLLKFPPPTNFINDKNNFCSGGLNRKHSEELFRYLKIDKRPPPAVKLDLATSIMDTKRRSLRMRIKNGENIIPAETYRTENVRISKCHINRSRICKFSVADTINANMSVAEVLEILKSENNNKSDIEIVHNYLKPDLKLHTSGNDEINTKDNGLEEMFEIWSNKPDIQDNNLVSRYSSNKQDIFQNIVKTGDCSNIPYKDTIADRLNFKDNLETTTHISSKSAQEAMKNTLKCIKLHGELIQNLNMKRDVRKRRILRSSYNISKTNEKSRIINILENHLESSRKETLINRRFKCKNRNMPFNIIKLRSGKTLNGRSIQNSRLLKNKRKNNAKMIKDAKSKELKGTAKNKEISQNVNEISNNLENIISLKTSPKRILDFSGEIKLGQYGIQLNNICSKQAEISSRTCSAFTKKDNKSVKTISKLENFPETDSNSNPDVNEDDSGIVSDEESYTKNEENSLEIIGSKDEYSCDNKSNCNTFVLRVRSNSLSVKHPIITKKLKRSNSVNMNNETEVDLDGLLELHKTYEKKVNLYSLASKEGKRSTSKLSLQNLAKDFDESDIVENILHRNNIIVVIRKLNVCFYEHETSSTFFGSPKYWQYKGKVKRYIPLKECRLTQVTNSIFYCTATCTVAYVEIFGRQRPVYTARSSLLCEVTAAVYSYELNNTPQMSLVHLDYPMCLHINVIFTVIPWERAVVLGYISGTNCDEFNIKKYVINNHHRSVQKSYSLPKARFHCTNLHSIDDDIIVGFGNGQVVLWNHLTQEIIFTINKLFIKSYLQPQNLIDDLFQNTICVWTRLDSIMNTLHLLLYSKLKSYLALVLIQKNRKQYKVLHKYYISDKYNRVLDVTIGQYKLAINFDEGALAYDFPLDFQTDSSHVTNVKFFPPFTLFPNDRYVVHLENDVAFSMTVDRL